MSNKTYRVVRGSIKIPRTAESRQIADRNSDFIVQGELLPPDTFSQKEILSWLSGGRIEEADNSLEEAQEEHRIRLANPFRADPASLVGASMEDLVIMVLEIDPEYDTDSLEDEQAAVQLLTSGWDPKYRQTIAPVNDRARPETLAMHKLEQTREGGSATHSSDSEMSEAAQTSLANAKARANAPKEETE